jgi:hypothetical protein
VRRFAALAATVLLITACTSDDDADPSPTTRETTSTSLVDHSGVVLPGVGGETTTTLEEKGTARLVGTVTGPAGPLGGATVRIDRFVGGREVRHDVVTAADGRWELRDVPGGRYRVRAFQAPTYAQSEPELRFLADDEEHSFDLTVEDQRGIVVRADVAPDEPLLGGDVNLVVLVVERTVSPDGVVRSRPLDGTFVELVGLGRWVLRDDDDSDGDGGTGGTDGFEVTTSTTLDDGGSPSTGVFLSDAGRARYELRCESGGAPGLSLRVPVLLTPDPGPPGTGSTTTTTAEPVPRTEDVSLELPACADPDATTTTTTPSSSTP